MEVKSIAVIVKSEKGEIYQVALNNEKLHSLLSDLRNLYFSGEAIKILPNKLEGIEFGDLTPII